MNRKTLFQNVEAVAQGLSEFFGESIEVVVHDFADPDRSILAMYGNLTGRRVGDPAPGRPLKASTVFLRDGSGSIIGALSVNYDLTETLLLSNSLERFSRRTSAESAVEAAPIVGNGVGGQIERAFAEAADAVGRPAPLMARAQKVRVVHDLERRGIFLIKGAVDEVAQLLGVSRYTVYNYRKEVSAV